MYKNYQNLKTGQGLHADVYIRVVINTSVNSTRIFWIFVCFLVNKHDLFTENI